MDLPFCRIMGFCIVSSSDKPCKENPYVHVIVSIMLALFQRWPVLAGTYILPSHTNEHMYGLTYILKSTVALGVLIALMVLFSVYIEMGMVTATWVIGGTVCSNLVDYDIY